MEQKFKAFSATYEEVLNGFNYLEQQIKKKDSELFIKNKK